jgi:3-oxoacyl-[acyl-carrier protein] reductase
MNLTLQDKTAVICGSSQGIGYSIAEELALIGANCILLARNAESLAIAVTQLDTTLRQMHTYYLADFGHPDQVQKAINEILEKHTVHILINNTGGPPAGPVLDASSEQFLHAFNQHLLCNHLLAQAVVPGMKHAGYGRIVNIISTSVKIPLKHLGVSNTIRGAVASWSKTMANELGQFNITVNNVLPGFTKTQRLESLVTHTSIKNKKTIEEVENDMKEDVPMKRFGEASEIAAVAAFLCSPAASYVNGVSIPVDGGRTGSI